ncbi:putative yippee family protein [Diaporthe ampelina]|uniref:Putative yippee family protein n=1 Tax=Diaporthe ampelina TaxID=1214573 RepID=A0A0G2HEZ5_9PEZI|nr:putative yippee family protein [Diaporthe ampelina]
MNVFRSSSSSTQSPKADTGPLFATYLLPSLKIPFFRRRQSSATTSSSTAASNDVPSLSSSPTSANSVDDLPYSPTASIPGVETCTFHLDDDKPSSQAPQQPPRTRRNSDRGRLSRPLPDVLRCTTCGTDVAYGLQVVSKGFTGRHGRALLVSPPLPSSTPSCPGPPSGTSSSPAPASAATPPNPSSYSSLARDGVNLVNVAVGAPEKRSLVTGMHVVADITCATCGVKIGWKYVDAREQAQKYKVGKFILETERVALHRTWEDASGPDGEQGAPRAAHFYSCSAPADPCGGGGGGRRASGLGGRRKVSCSSEETGVADGGDTGEEGEEGGSLAQSDGEVMFDSEDEDECEDIFAGTWDAATVARRRGSKVGGGGGGGGGGGYTSAAKRAGGRR